MYDVVIVGGGPAGLSAALVLGRCRRKILVCDDGHPRNAASGAAHGFLTRDGIAPMELLELARDQLRPYGVEMRQGFVESATCMQGGFEVKLRGGERLESRKLLLATGVQDTLPDIPGIHEYYGSSIHHCPYCDGWEWRDQPVAVYGGARGGLALAAGLLTWTRDIVLLTAGLPLSGAATQRLKAAGIPVRTSRIARLIGNNGLLDRIVLEDGESIERRAIFFSAGQNQRSNLAEQLGCAFTKKGAVRTSRKEAAGTPGLYVAGDASRDMQFIVVAAAEGAKAAVAINKELQAAEHG